MPVTKVSFKNDFMRRTGNTTPSSCVVLPWLRSSWTLLCKHQLSDLPPRQRCDVEFHFLFHGRGVIGPTFTNILLLAEDYSYSATPPILGGIYGGRGGGVRKPIERTFVTALWDFMGVSLVQESQRGFTTPPLVGSPLRWELWFEKLSRASCCRCRRRRCCCCCSCCLLRP